MPQEEHRIAALEAVNIPREIRARSRRRHQPLIQAVDDQNVARPLPSIHQAMVVGEALCAIGTAPPSAQVSEPAGVQPARKLRLEVHHVRGPRAARASGRCADGLQRAVDVVEVGVADAFQHLQMVSQPHAHQV
eukprot:CAMPEP_0177282050 /NCGR_PEP_ID=MMETSP0367-20130122/71244_1 /TAXON_ID=447022 ORGANISM="Scrippsiella hangoei-like, Strain SHHI-4" /NCGR_SAMPLE_ID=MMETSP0367 /ASSEMBLY_ACC=CAM_ASM_000362 /LENGTH=133 /DNA_ID=CAMNT_0018738927 /DNA_START=291 /DNA_END=689 /DNA_ORIENTATION=-